MRPAIALPEELHGAAITLRRYQLSDAAALHEAIAVSFDHLRPWMPWAQNPPTDASVRDFLVPSVEFFGREPNAHYAITDAGSGAYLGGCSLMQRIGPGALEIGYWVDTRMVRRGIATEAARILTDAAFALPGIERVEIHCDEANVASAGVPRRLGYRLVRIDDDVVEAPAEVGRSMIWVVDRETWGTT